MIFVQKNIINCETSASTLEKQHHLLKTAIYLKKTTKFNEKY